MRRDEWIAVGPLPPASVLAPWQGNGSQTSTGHQAGIPLSHAGKLTCHALPRPPHQHFTLEVLQQQGNLGVPRGPHSSMDPAVEALHHQQGSSLELTARKRRPRHHLSAESREAGSLLPHEPRLLP